MGWSLTQLTRISCGKDEKSNFPSARFLESKKGEELQFVIFDTDKTLTCIGDTVS